MTILCRICKYAIRSDKPEIEAQADVTKKMSQHLGAVHLPQAQEFAKILATIANTLMGLQALASSYLLLAHFVDIPESEAALLASYQKCRANLIEPDPIGILELTGEIVPPTPRAPKSGILH